LSDSFFQSVKVIKFFSEAKIAVAFEFSLLEQNSISAIWIFATKNQVSKTTYCLSVIKPYFYRYVDLIAVPIFNNNATRINQVSKVEMMDEFTTSRICKFEPQTHIEEISRGIFCNENKRCD